MNVLFSGGGSTVTVVEVSQAGQAEFSHTFDRKGGGSIAVLNMATGLWLIENVDYAVEDVGGFQRVVLQGEALPVGTLLALLRNTPIARTADYQPHGDYRAETVNTEIERIFAILEEFAREAEKAVRLPYNASDETPRTLPVGIEGRALVGAADGGYRADGPSSETLGNLLQRIEDASAQSDTAAQALAVELNDLRTQTVAAVDAAAEAAVDQAEAVASGAETRYRRTLPREGWQAPYWTVVGQGSVETEFHAGALNLVLSDAQEAFPGVNYALTSGEVVPFGIEGTVKEAGADGARPVVVATYYDADENVVGEVGIEATIGMDATGKVSEGGAFAFRAEFSRDPARGATFTAPSETTSVRIRIAGDADGSRSAKVRVAAFWIGDSAMSPAALGRTTVLSRAELKDLRPVLGARTFLVEGDRSGEFYWDGGVPVTQHQIDTREGIWVAPDPTKPGAWKRRYRGARDPLWFGMDPTGVEDATPAIHGAFCNASRGATLRFSEDCGTPWIGSDLVLPVGCRMEGASSFTGGVTLAMLEDKRPRVEVSPSARIKLDDATEVHGLYIRRKNFRRGPTLAQIVSEWTGTCFEIEARSTNIELTGLLVVGFLNLGVSPANVDYNGRIFMDHVHFDCINGPTFAQSYDISRYLYCQSWPYATAHGESAPEPNNAHLTRPGVAFNLVGANDWTQVIGCFDYGHFRGFRVGGGNQCTFTDCGADHVPGAERDGSIGFLIEGVAENTKLIGCQSAAKSFAVWVDSSDTRGRVEINAFTSWEFDNTGIQVQNGDVLVVGGVLRGSGGAERFGVRTSNPNARAQVIGTRFEDLSIGLVREAGRVRHSGCSFDNVTNLIVGAAIEQLAVADTITPNGTDVTFALDGSGTIETIRNPGIYVGREVSMVSNGNVTLGGAGNIAGGSKTYTAGQVIRLIAQNDTWQHN